MKHTSITIRIHDSAIVSTDGQGQTLKQGQAGSDDAAVIQDAIDRLKETMGGQVHLGSGTYVLDRAIQVHLPVTISGEGRATEIRPPKGDFAFKVHHDGEGLERHHASFREPPAHFEKVPGWQTNDLVKPWLEGRGTGFPRLWGVQIRDLAIQGHGQGKGIFMSWLTESTFRDLWINNCADGAALFLEQQVMECVFENLHLSNCGSPANKEATITMRSESGDPCNNLWFRSIYVIFPQYIGIEIGSSGKPRHPRLIWFEDCMIHGWHVLVDPAPYDLIRINKTDPTRPICFRSCRITNGAKETAYLRVREGRVKVEDSVFGPGNQGRVQLLVAEPRALLQAIGNTLNGANQNHALDADRAEVLFTGNQVRGCVLNIRSPRYARITDNTFESCGDEPIVHLTDTEQSPSGPVMLTGNIFKGSKKYADLDLRSNTDIIDRDNISIESGKKTL